MFANKHEVTRVLDSIEKDGIPLWVKLDIVDLILGTQRGSDGLGDDYLIRSMRHRLLDRRGLTRDYSNERPVPYHLIDQPPVDGERRVVFFDGYPDDVHGFYGADPDEITCNCDAPFDRCTHGARA